MNGIENKAEPFGEVELARDGLNLLLNVFFSDANLFGELLIVVAPGKHRKELSFLRCEATGVGRKRFERHLQLTLVQISFGVMC